MIWSEIMNRALLKDTLRTIDRTKSRFISLIAIVALGVSFFAGINATAPDMRDTARQYYIDTNAMDLQVISTAGLTTYDAYVLGTIPGVEAIPVLSSRSAQNRQRISRRSGNAVHRLRHR